MRYRYAVDDAGSSSVDCIETILYSFLLYRHSIYYVPVNHYSLYFWYIPSMGFFFF